MGSKSSICNEMIRAFPKAENFYDVFGGGFSVTHAMLVRRPKDFKRFHFNEIRPGISDLIRRAIRGDYDYDKFLPKWISREEFLEKIDTDPMVKILWSFGNNGRCYLFSKEIEPYKRSMHNAVVFNEFDDLAKQVLGMDRFRDGYSINSRRIFLRSKIERYRVTKIPEFLFPYLNESQREQLASLQTIENMNQQKELQQLQQLQRLEQLERLEQLQQLQQLQQLERLELSSFSYEKVQIKENSVVYCDPPYSGTTEYDGGFNHKEFFEWAHALKEPVFISEYNIPDRRFVCIWQTGKRSMLSSYKTMKVKTERLYVNQSGLARLRAQGRING